MSHAWAPDLNPTYVPMTDNKARIFLSACWPGPLPEEIKKTIHDLFLVQILKKRIEVLKLPVEFDDKALLAATALTDRPGAIVVLLIDCLNAYEGKTVTPGLLADLYPIGFYDEPTLLRYIDEFMKTRKVRWSEVY